MRHIPNVITCLNLTAGCIACLVAMNGNYKLAMLWVIIAAVLDFFDGFAARLLKAYSAIGKELDSLADLVSFGVAPAMVVSSFVNTLTTEFHMEFCILPYLVFVLTVFSALRLAKFNIDERQTDSFLGLPTPANALFWCSLIATIAPNGLNHLILYTIGTVLLIIISCWLMVSEVPMFSLKFKNYTWKDNKVQYIFIILSIIGLLLFQYTGICMAIVLYVIISLILQAFRNNSPVT